MKYSDKVELEQASQAIANEMLANAREERKAKQSAQLFFRLIKLVAGLVIIGVLVFLAKPYILGNEIRDRQRRNTVNSIVRELDNYKTTHNNSLPKEYSRKQWQNEFVDVYLKRDRSFMTEPSSKEPYQIEVNYHKTADELKSTASYRSIYIDQSHRCGTNGNLVAGAGSAIAAVRVKLESGEIYCAEN